MCVYVKNEKGEVVASDCIDQTIVTAVPVDLTPHLTVKLIPPAPNLLKSTDLWRIIATNASTSAYKAFLITVDLKEKTTGAQVESKLSSVTIAGSKSFSFNDFNTTDLTYRNTKLQEVYGKNMNAPDGNYTICVYVKNEKGEVVASDCIDQTIVTAVPVDLTPHITVKLIPLAPNILRSTDLWRIIATNASAAAYKAYLITVDLKEKTTGAQAESKLSSVIIAGSKSFSFNDFNTADLIYRNTKLQEAYGKNMNAPDGNYTMCVYVKNEKGEVVASDCIDQTIVTAVPVDLTPHITVKLIPPAPNILRSTDLWRIIATNASAAAYKAYLITVDLKEKTTGAQAESKLSSVIIAGSKSFSFNDFNTADLIYRNTKLQEAYGKNMNAPDGNYTMCVYVKNERGEVVASDCIDQTIVTAVLVDLTPHITVKLIPPAPNLLRSTDLWRIIATNASATAYKAYLITVDLKEKTTGAQAESKLSSVIIAGSKSFSFNDFNTADLIYRNTKLQEAYGKNMNAPDGNYTMCVYVKNEKREVVASDCIDQTIITIKPEKVNLQLISPPDGSVLISNQPVLFSWMLLSMKPGTIINYRIKVVEIQGNQSPIEAVSVNPAWFEKEDITTTALNYPVAAAKFENGKKYAWQITAYLKNEEIGKSETWSFIYNTEEITNIMRCDVFKVEFIKAAQRDTISYKLLITNSYKGSFAGNKPGSFRITVKSDSIVSIAGGVSDGWKRTPSKFPPGSTSVKWTNNSGDIPNEKTELGNIVFHDIYSKPVILVYEWLDKVGSLICKDSSTFIESRSYYELTTEIPNNIIEVSGSFLNIQFANNYAPVDDLILSIYDIEKYKLLKHKSVKPVIAGNVKKHLNSNGLNRISIDMKEYQVQPKTTYLLVVTDSKNNYYLNFKVTN